MMKLVLSFCLSVILVLPASAKSKLPWPETFSGQPDFEFTDERVQKERAVQKGSKAILPEQSLSKTNRSDLQNPFKATNALVAQKRAAEEEALAKQEAERALREKELAEKQKSYELIDLTSFRNKLRQSAAAVIKNTKPDLYSAPSKAVTSRLNLEAIATSPFRYAIVNGKQLQEGQSLKVQLPYSVPEDKIEAAMRKHLPNKLAIPEYTYKQYDMAFQEELAAHKANRAENPKEFVTFHDVPVSVQQVDRVRVRIQFLGKSQWLLYGQS